MSKTISFDPFDPDSIDKALSQLTAPIVKKANKFVSMLEDEGLKELNIRLQFIKYDGVNADFTTIQETPDGFEIIWSGEKVCFIEFGAGTYFNGAWSYPGDRPPGVEMPGDYGIKGNDDYWFYTGQPGNAGGELAYGHKNSTITHGNPANAPMWKTANHLRQRLVEIAKEAFND